MPELPKRLLSIDVLRAVIMLLMIFVNDASGVHHIPEWIDHAKANQDAMGFADVIFPAFLFIVGLSLPFAIKNRIKKGDSTAAIIIYILTRSAALLIMGFYHVNLEEYSSASLLPKPIWALIITIAFFMIWLDFPEHFNKVKRNILIGTGIILLLLLAIIYKGGSAEHVTGMRPSWWGILGIIGWSYLVCALLYVVSKGKLGLLLLFLILFAGVNIGVHTGIVSSGLWIIGDASSVTLTLFGMVISVLYVYLVAKNKTHRLWLILFVTGVLSIVFGLLIRSYAQGISKIHSTPAWIFICAGTTILAFELAIYLIDVKGKSNVFSLIKPAGTSTLTCYLMPYFQVYLLQLFHVNYPPFLNNGAGGLLRAMATAFILIWLVGLMEKKHLRLKI
jgi:heparan-alpha-glucosaminide N-acetyltransferase